MFVNHKLRRRRQNRIKAILEQRDERVNKSITPLEQSPYDKRLEDPEFVWKMNRNRWGLDKTHVNVMERKVRRFFVTKKQLQIQAITSIVLFALISIIFKMEHPVAVKGKHTVTSMLTSDFQFQEAFDWYGKFFHGSPAFIPTFHKKKAENVHAEMKEHFYLPVQGEIIVPFRSTNKGIQIKAEPMAPIVSMGTGRIIYVGEREHTGITIVIQHAQGWQSIYGGVGQTSYQVNDWVEGGQPIGKLSVQSDPKESVLYFSIKQDHQFVNPAEVIELD